MRFFRVFGVAGVAMLLGGLAASQTAPVDVLIDDAGAVIAQHQERHVKNGQVLRWRRTSAGSWYVNFRDSPCADGIKEFGSTGGRRQTCTVTVDCSKAGDSGCRDYHYSSATSPNATMHDPDIVVEN